MGIEDRSAPAIDYHTIIREQMGGIIARVVDAVARQGIPDGHELWITFVTAHPANRIPDWVRARFPVSLTISMGSTYWDLRADKAGFSVELLFNGNRERVEVAYDAITGFKDRASNINLDIAPPSMPASPDPEPPPDAVQRVDTSSGPSNVVFGVFGRKRGTAAE